MLNFKPQKVQHLKDALKLKTPKIQGDYLITEKIEGWDTTIFYDIASKTWYPPISSRGNRIPSLLWTVDLFNKLPKPNHSCFLKAEAYRANTPFHILNGILNRSVGNFSFKDVEFHFHDLVYINKQEDALTRYMNLQALVQQTEHFNILTILAITPYHNELWNYHFEQVANKGGEGIVAKRADSYYSFGKRNSDLLKLKLEEEVDCLAVRLEEGIGEKGNYSLTLISKRKNGTKIRTVISKHEDQLRFTTTPSEVIGKVITIKCMEQYEDGNLRQPVFSCIRSDKSNDDYQ
jgi:ATP-dependent DNA ligase